MKRDVAARVCSVIRDLLVEAARAGSWARLRAGLSDPLCAPALLLGCAGFFLGPAGGALAPHLFDAGTMAMAGRMLYSAVMEELTFRVLLQEQLEHAFPTRSLLSPANLLTSAIFALSHLPTQPVTAALSTFFPALVFGALWTRSRSLWLCAGVHLWYNVAWRF